ncbi:hypothetical protein AWV80_14690 [Cupriavidus sp. UYMU48A]|nr:hypothetical protein AWV80_14690 [Cupriavidus sp. UYMU48A]
MATLHAKTLLAALASTTMLAACGGGDSSTTTATPQATPNLTGKAIDGYLVGATVCVDVNGNGACDAGEPSAKTDGNGNFGLVTTGNVVGKRLLVTVDTGTKDLSRPNYSFPASFTLSTEIDGTTSQHVTPLTTMVQALVDAGQSRAAAERNVISLLGGSVNLKDDYIASGNSTVSAFASKVVDKVTTFAKSGSADRDTVRAVMNAIAEKGGDIAAVTQADVDKHAARPVFSDDVDLKALMAEPLYAVTGVTYTTPPVLMRNRYTLVGNELTGRDQYYNPTSNVWVDGLPPNSAPWSSQYQLRADGTWTGVLSEADQNRPALVQSISGNQAIVVDQNSGLVEKLVVRRSALGGKSIGASLAGWIGDSLALSLSGTFAADSNAYLGAVSHERDRVSVDLYTCTMGNPVTDDGVPHCNFIGDANRSYQAVDDVFGLSIPFGTANLVLSANGKAQLLQVPGGQVAMDSDKIGWERYAANRDILVIKLNPADVPSGINVRGASFMEAGGRVAIVLRNGRLQFADLEPASMEETIPLFRQSVFDQVVNAVRQAVGV